MKKMPNYVPPAPVTIVPDKEGKTKSEKVTFSYNKVTKRYDLRIGGVCVCSGVSPDAVLRRADNIGVVWE